MKRAFTLLEVTIAITLFMILLMFLYKTLDQTKHSNKIFEKKQESLLFSNSLNKLFLEDFAEAKSKITITVDDDKRTTLKFQTNNLFHNPYFTYVTYILGSNDTLIRMESKEEFKGRDSLLDFYESVYIDILLKDVEVFEVKELNSEYVLVIKQKNRQREVFKAFKLGD